MFTLRFLSELDSSSFGVAVDQGPDPRSPPWNKSPFSCQPACLYTYHKALGAANLDMYRIVLRQKQHMFFVGVLFISLINPVHARKLIYPFEARKLPSLYAVG